MKKCLLIITLGLFGLSGAYAQQKIKDGTTGTNVLPTKDAILELESSNKGLLHSRVTLKATRDASPLVNHVAGMMVYNTAKAGDVEPGIYYNDGTKWVSVRGTSTTIVESQEGNIGKPGKPGAAGGPGVDVVIVNNSDGTWVYNPTTEEWTLVAQGGNVSYTANQFTYIDKDGDVKNITFSDIIEGNETVTTLLNNGDGTYTYTNEENDLVIIDVPAGVISEFQTIINNGDVQTILNDYISNNTGGNVSYDGIDFYYVDNSGSSAKIDLEKVVKDKETVTTLTKNANGTYTYKNEARDDVVIDPSMVNVAYKDGVYTFTDAGGTLLTEIRTSAGDIIYNNTISGLVSNNVQDAIDELVGKIEDIEGAKGDLSLDGGLEFIGITDGAAKLLADAGIQIAEGGVTEDKLGSGTATAGQVATANGDGTVTYKNIAITDANIASTKGVTTDGIIKVNSLDLEASSVLKDMEFSIANESITSTQIKNGEVKTADLADKNITAGKLDAGTGNANRVAIADAAGNVTYTNAIPSGSITGENVTAGSDKVTFGGTPIGAALKAFSIDVDETKLSLNANQIKGGTTGQIIVADADGKGQWVSKDATTVSNSSLINNLMTTVNGVTGAAVSIVNSNELSIDADNKLVSTVNGVDAVALDLTPLIAAQGKNLTAAGDAEAATIEVVTGGLGAALVETSLRVKAESITSAQIKDGTIKPEDLENGGNDKVLTTDDEGNPIWVDKAALGTEPWFVQKTTTSEQATLNAQNIYQMGTVAIGKVEALAGVSLDVEGAVRGGIENVGDVGENSAAFGKNNTVSGVNSGAIGIGNTVSQDNAVAFGGVNNISNAISGEANWGAAAFGQSNTITAMLAQAFGNTNKVDGDVSSAFGQENTTSGYASAVFGWKNTASSPFELVLGRYNAITTSSILSNAMETVDDVKLAGPTDPVLQIGNGTSEDARGNSLTVLTNGNVGVGIDGLGNIAKPTERFDVGSGNVKVRDLPDTDGATTDKVVVVDADGVLKSINAKDVGAKTTTVVGANSDVVVAPAVTGNNTEYKVAVKAAMPKFFYMPSIVFDVSTPGAGLRELHTEYINQFTGAGNPTLVISEDAPEEIPHLPEAEDLHYYVTYYDTEIFENLSISKTGKLEYTVKAGATVTESSFMNIVFVIKD